MADSKRLQILKALTTRLETITVANGYQFDLDGSVYRGRTGFGDETPLPCIGIFQLRPEEALRADETVQSDDWFIGVQGYVESDDTHPTDTADILLADIKTALSVVMRPDTPVNRNPDYMFNGLVADMFIDGGISLPPSADVPGVSTCVLKITFKVVDELEDLYV